jgi:hypothetical protein
LELFSLEEKAAQLPGGLFVFAFATAGVDSLRSRAVLKVEALAGQSGEAKSSKGNSADFFPYLLLSVG